MKSPSIYVTFSTVSEESVQHGGFSRIGWVDPLGDLIEDPHDKPEPVQTFDPQDDQEDMAKDLAGYLKSEGAVHSSTWPSTTDSWWSDEGNGDDKRLQEDELDITLSYHLEGFPEEVLELLLEEME